MTTRSTRRVGPLAIVCAWLAVACLADASAAGAAPAAASAASGAPASAPAGAAATQYAVKPGQSLADIAIAATQSHDRNIVARASKAIFDANPSAFMRGDPSLLKLGAVLNVPPLDATGAPVKAEAAPAVAAASVPNASSAPASASAASAAAASAGAASAKASGVQATKPASSSAGSGPQGAASGAASAPGPAPAVAKPAAPTAATRPQPGAPIGASGGHAWTGAIEAASAPAAASEAAQAGASGAEASAAVAASGAAAAPAVAGESASGGTAATGASGAAAASAPKPGAPASTVAASAAAASHPKVSSLQQLLTLKNRVLMELQRHGFGAPSSVRSGAAGNAPAGASGFAAAPPASGVVALAPGQSRQAAAANQRFIGIGDYGFNVARSDVPAIAAVIAAVCAALLVLLIALGVSRRKRRAPRPIVGAAAAGSAAAIERDEPNPPVAPPAAAANDPIEAEFLAILARNPSSKRALMGLAAHYAERKNVRGFDEIAQRIYRLSSGRGPNWVHVAALGRQLDPDNPLFALEAGATNEDVLSEASETDLPTESTADVFAPAVPPAEPPQPPVEQPSAASAIPVLTDVAPPEAPITEVPSSGETLPEAEAAHQAAPDEAAAAPGGPQDQAGSTPALEPDAAPEPRGEATLPPEAVAALGGLDLGLPPRIEGGAERAHDTAHDAAHERGHDADEAPIAPPEAYTESPLAAEPREPAAEREPTPARVEPPARPAVSGLGAAPVGPLKLSFNLDLPGDETGEHEASAAGAPLPQFTPEQLAKIARNKLDLASEYIALGDLGGARTLIHEVIESNDAGTHDEAHALLATLAPLS